ncbi:uncharacterized protein LOC124460832 [Drosophila willistoni]|uniref:uncharacterized protein LOC124460832 n=1 Tax=Drosophila willistoni TaxID=7260 RepID=UPI001F0764AF|nr:uncharacterized protein LOC124460832 [Drosophila willistoni]
MEKYLVTSAPLNNTSDTNAAVPIEQQSYKRKRNASEVWTHFEKCKNNSTAKCKVCGKEYKRSGNTSNLMDHLKRSHSTRQILLDKSLAKMVARDVHAYRIVEDLGFQEFVHLLDPKYKMPSRTTLQNVYIKNMNQFVFKL